MADDALELYFKGKFPGEPSFNMSLSQRVAIDTEMCAVAAGRR